MVTWLRGVARSGACPGNARGPVLVLSALVATVCTAEADDHKPERKEHHNYIIKRQEAYQVQGVLTSRIIVGKREIDVYPNGMMF